MRKGLLAGAVLLALAGYAYAQSNTLCAVVKLQILQTATFEREAFDAQLIVSNNLPTTPFTDLKVQITIKNSNGDPVDNLFFVKVTTLTGTNAVDGTGVVQSSSTAQINWLIIPSSGTGGINPAGQRYAVKAAITGMSGTDPQGVTTFDEYITVHPQPVLRLEYVLPYEVFGDEPLTTGVIEGVEPFPLGVRVTNIGYGTATDFKIDSAQPKILENKLNLPIDFKLLGSVVSGKTIPNTLLIPFGDIGPAGVGQASWLMSTTLSGRFIEFKSTFTHAASLGGDLTSLIQDIRTYTLLHDVLVDLPGRDRVPDFLVNSSVDRNTMQSLLDTGEQAPAELLLESDQPEPLPVVEVPADLTGTLGGTDAGLSFVFTAPVSSNVWVHSSVPFPYGKGANITSARRADGKVINLGNVWISKHFRKGDLKTLYRLNLLDLTGQTTAYVVQFSPLGLDQPPSPVTDLAAGTGPDAGSLNLSWTAPGEDQTFGGITGGRYIVAASVSSTTVFTPLSAQVNVATSTLPGNAENLLVKNLIGNATTYVRLWTQDTGGNVSEVSNGATAYTLPYPPKDIVFDAITTTSIFASWQIGNNRLPIGYQVSASSAPEGAVLAASPVFDSFTSTFTFGGLSANATIYFTGVGLNTETGVASAASMLGSTVTYAAAPSSGSLLAVEPSSVAASWSLAGNPADTEFYAELSTSPDHSPVARASGWIRATTAVFGDLTPQTSYYGQVKARNYAGVETAYADLSGAVLAGADATPPAPVTDLSASVAGSSQTAAAVVLTWTAPGDDGAAGAIIAGQLDLRYSSATADYAAMEHQVLMATAAEPGAARSYPIDGLERGLTYTFALRYADEAGNFSAASTLATARTYEETAFGSFAVTTTTIRIEAPQASTLTATAVAYAALPLDARTALTAAKLALVGGVFDVLPEGTAFDPPARFTMRWLDADNDGIEDTLGLAESGLVLRKWSGSQWTPVPVLSRDEAANEITVEVSLLASLFGITGPTGTPPGLSGPLARPGAFTPNLDELTFEYRANEAVTASVEVRNASNQLVRTFPDRVANPGLVLASENATFTGPGNGKSVRLRGGYAYYTENETLSVFDLRDPAQPVRAAALQLTPANSGGAGESVEIIGSRLFVSVATPDGTRLAAVDISTPSSPAVTAVTASTFTSGLSNLTRSSDGRFLFGASTDELGNPHIAAFDVSGGQPVLATHTALASPVNAMSVQGGTLYTMSQDAVLRLYDLAAPGAPLAEAGQLSLGNQAFDLAFSPDGLYLYAASGDLKVVDVAVPASPALVRAYTAAEFQRGSSFASNSRVLAHGHFLYVPGASNIGFIDVFDIIVPTAPVILGQHVFSTQDQDTGVMAASGNTLLALHTKATVLTVRPSGSDRVAWDGRDASGMVVAAGTYTVVVDALDAYGDAASTATTVAVNPAYATPALADTVAPVLSAPLAHADPFTPNLGELTVEYRADEAVTATVEIRDSSNQLVKAFPGRVANPGLVVASEDSTFTGPGNGQSVRLRGGYAYYSEGDKLSVFDLRDPAQPVRAAALQFADNGGGSSVELVGSRLFVSIGAQLAAIDISTPSSPAVTALSASTFSSLSNLTRSTDGRFLFAGAYDELGSPSIAAFDLTGGQPVLTTRTALGSPVTAMNLLGRTLYTMSQDGALRLYDLSTPETGLSETGQLSLGGWAINVDFSADGRYLYAATGDLKVVDITVPSAPALVRAYTAADFQRGASFASDARVLAHGNFLFIPGASNVGFIDVFDVIVPTAPVFRGEHVFATQDQDTSAMAASGNTLLALHGKSTVLTVRPSGSDRVAWDGRDASNAAVAAGTYTVVVNALDGYGNAASTSAAFVVNPAYATPTAADAVAPALSGLLARPNPYRPRLEELLLEYRADEAVNATVEIRNSSNQLVRTFSDRIANPGLAIASENAVFTGPGNGQSVRLRDGYAYYSEGDKLSVFDLRNPAQPVRAAALQFADNGGGSSVELVGSRLFVSIGAQLAAVDISTPSSPAVAALSASTFSSLSSLTRSTDGRFLFAGAYDELGSPSIAAFDVTGGQPVLATRTALGSAVGAMQVRERTLYALSQDGVLRLYDLSTPETALTEAGQLSLGNALDLAFSPDGRYLYTASGDLKVVDITVPASPTLVRAYTAAEFQRGSSFASNSRVLSHGNFLYVPGYSNVGFIDVFDILVPTAPVIRGQHVFATQNQDTAVMAASGNTLLALNGTATVLTVRPSGSDRVAWDGRDSSNMAVAPGTYTFVVSALDGSGNAATSSGDFVISTGAAPAPPQTFTAVSGDGAGKIASSRSDETITAVSTDTVAAAYGVAVSSQGLVLVMPSLYELSPSPVVFSPPATLTFRFDAVGVDTATVSIYRFNGVTWDSAPVTGQQLVAVGGGLFDISGILQSASLYAVFSLPAPAPALASITVTPSSATLLTGTTALFEAAGTFTDGSTRTLTGEVAWTTDVSSIATVDASGLATGMAAGAARVIASSGAFAGHADLTVTEPFLPGLSLKGYWKMDESTGTTLVDELGSSSAALTGARTAGVRGGGIAPDAVGSIAVGPVDLNTAAWTIMGWFRIDAARGDTGDVLWGNLYDGYTFYDPLGWTICHLSQGSAMLDTNQGGFYLTSPAAAGLTVNDGAWHHAAQVYGGGVLKLYVDGVYLGGESRPATLGARSRLNFGNGGPREGGYGKFVGDMDEFAVLDRALSQTELLAVKAQITLSTAAPAPALVSIAVTPSTAAIAAGTTTQFEAMGTFTDASTRTLTVDWTTDVSSVVTVAAGLATGVGAGTAQVIASSGAITGFATLTVTAPPPAALTVTEIAPSSAAAGTAVTAALTGTGFDASAALTLERAEVLSGTWTATGSFAQGRFMHTLTKLADGRVLLAGGASDASGGSAAADLYDPATGLWTAAAPMNQGRSQFSAVRLADGRVLAAGGDAGGPLASAELFDPALNAWTTAAPMSTVRVWPELALLADGRVLAVGGIDGAGYLSSAEIFDPASGAWSPAAPMNAGRAGAAVARLNGGKVLVAGGFGGVMTAEVYDPATNAWAATTGALSSTPYLPRAVVLANGKVLVAGGSDGGLPSVYDPATNAWSTTGPMAAPRYVHALVPVDGTALSIGGENGSGNLGSTEIYDAATNAWRAGPSLTAARTWLHAVALDDGRILAAGGLQSGVKSNTAELLGAAPVSIAATGVTAADAEHLSGTLELTGAATGYWDVVVRQSGGRIGRLDGGFLVMPGAPALASITVTPLSASIAAGAALQFEAAGTFTDGSTRTVTGEVVWTTNASSVATVNAGLATGVGPGTAQVIASSGAISGYAILTVTAPALTVASIAPSSAAAGTSVSAALAGTGFDASAALTLERAEVLSGTWTATGSFAQARFSSTLTKLRDGRLLLAGGMLEGSAAGLADTDLYDPATGAWTAASPMRQGRNQYASVMLADGRVLVSGGQAGVLLSSVEIYDPTLSTWTAAAPMSSVREGHELALLPDGRVLAAGGWNGSSALNSAEIYDPAADAWSPAPAMSAGRFFATAATLSGGRIMIAGGSGVDTAEIYDPETNAWTAAGTMSTARYLHRIAVLPSGKVLVSGGSGPTGTTNKADVYDPATNAWTATAPMGVPRYIHAMVLVDGTPLVVGGENTSTDLASTEIYDAATNAWRPGPSLAGTRTWLQAAVLDDGRVLTAGGRRGLGGGTNLNTAEVLGSPAAQLTATGVTAADAQHLSGTLELTGAATGYWDVVVRQSGGRVGRLNGGFRVLEGPTDFLAPVVSLSFSTPSYASSGGLVTIGTQALVSLFATDPSSDTPASGVAQILYAVDSTTPNVTYAAPFTLAAGPHMIYFSATDLAGNSSAVSSAALSAAESPFVGAFSPSSGPIGIGYTMAGFGFGTYGGTATRVKFGVSTTPVSVWNDAAIVGTVPGLSTGTYAVTVERLSGSTLTIAPAGDFTVTPMIPSLSVSSGPIGLPFTLTGTGFGTYAGANSRVLFAGTTAPISVWNDATISGTIPGVAAGTTTVVVERQTADGFVARGEPLSFTVTAPSVTAVSPSSAPIGAAFTLTGFSFGNYAGTNTRVLFDGTTAPIAVWNDHTITGTVPGGLAPGARELIVERRTADGGVSRSEGAAFVVQGLALAAVAPSSGAIGIPFTLTGTGFGAYLGANSRVKFGVSTAAVSVWNDTTISGTVPTLATGAYAVTVERQQGTDISVSDASTFTVIGLSIASVSPSSGPIGTSFTLSGAGFGPYAGVNTYLLLGGATTPIAVWNDSTITATVPGGLTPGVRELVAVRRNADGGLSASNTAYFEVTGMSIASLNPSTGPIGIPFTIKGSQFGVYLGANSRVRFGVSTAAVSVWNDTTITGTIPSLATGTHAVVLERQQGTEVTFSDLSSFTVTELAVGTLTPSSGPIGVAFTITGEHFGIYAGANTRLLLDGTTVAVAVWNDTTITGTVPNLEAGSRPLWLERKSGTGVQSSATTYFLVTTPEVATLTPSSAPIGAPFTITGSNFGPYAGANTRVKFNGVSAPISVWNDHAISGTVPGAVSTGPAVLVVERAAGAGVSQSAAQAFEVLLPVISTVSPGFGPAGTVVTLTGHGFGPYAGTATKLLVGGSTVAVSVWNDTTIRWTVTAAFPDGDYALVVRRAPAGGTVDSDSATFTVGTGYSGASFGFAAPLSLAAQPDVNFEGGLNLPVDEGGRVETPSKAAVEVPPNALEEDTEITLKRLHKDGLRTEASDAAKKRAAGEAIEFGPEGTLFNTPVTIELPYDPALTADESKLAVHYYDPLRRAWEELPSVVDRARHVVRAQTSHFSIYQPMGIAPTTVAQDEFYFRDQYAFPNPSRTGAAVTFRIQPGLADTIELRVYDLSGRKIHGSTDFTFRGAIDDGNGKGAQNTYDHVWGVSGVGSGVYRYVIKASRASQAPIVKSGKVGVIK